MPVGYGDFCSLKKCRILGKQVGESKVGDRQPRSDVVGLSKKYGGDFDSDNENSEGGGGSDSEARARKQVP